MEDISPELYNRIESKFKQLTYEHKAELDKIVAKIRRGNGKQADVAKYANRLGEMASASLKQVLKLDELPNSTLYRNIAEKTIQPLLERTWQDVNNKAALQLRASDKVLSMNVGIETGFAPKQRIKAVIDMAIGQTTQEQLDNALTDPVVSTARKFYDDFLEKNADLRSRLGFEEIVVRKYDDKGLHGGKDPCQWCLQREGTWTIEEAHANGVFERHPGCNCSIEVITPSRTQAQTDWTHNEWTDIR